MQKQSWRATHDGPGLLVAVMKALAGGARISFEGDLSRCRLSELPLATSAETPVLERSTLWPRQDFVVLPLEPDIIQPILDRVLPENRVLSDVRHIQIEKGGLLQFGSYDSFSPGCLCCGPAVPIGILDELRLKGILVPRDATHEGPGN